MSMKDYLLQFFTPYFVWVSTYTVYSTYKLKYDVWKIKSWRTLKHIYIRGTSTDLNK